ncbi:embryo-specific protein ATS3A-like [Phalaenopsis equestris]|uniref:embryo-specific protein ATS3A-like n=1 Tax=Phalaenopsis equestris TaxID=78828 RepID=UPI0009E61FDB|nr:embryo-specific protein ATS3A-like [Phalaenopsis equestris]
MERKPFMMMASAPALFVGLVAALSVTAVIAEAANPHPHPHPEELEQQHQLLLGQEVLDSGRARGCSYRVTIKTSCRSPRLTRDAVALSFGDAYNNQVYAPRLDDPGSRTFERCSTDTYDIAGPCGYGICYLYLWRDGPDGWIPEWVEVYDPYYGRYLTFYYGSPIPSGVWYGFNNCRRINTNATTTTATSEAVTASHDE